MADNDVKTSRKASEDVGPDFRKEIDPHFHTWSCGCKSRIYKGSFELIPCKDDCHIVEAVK